jgi:hypothetical protein
LETLAREKEVPLGAIRERLARGVGIGVHVELKQASEGAAWRRQVAEIVQVSGDAQAYVLTPVGV